MTPGKSISEDIAGKVAKQPSNQEGRRRTDETRPSSHDGNSHGSDAAEACTESSSGDAWEEETDCMQCLKVTGVPLSSPQDERSLLQKMVMPMKNLNVGDCVIVEYEEELYPGVSLHKKWNRCKVKVMQVSGVNWKWPSTEDVSLLLEAGHQAEDCSSKNNYQREECTAFQNLRAFYSQNRCLKKKIQISFFINKASIGYILLTC